MRTLLLAMTLFAAASWSAFAQSVASPPPAGVAVDSTRDAVRDIYQSLFFDSGLFDRMIPRYYEPWRDAIRRSDYYRTATSAHRQALEAIPAAMSEVIRRDITSESALMATNVAPSAVSILSPEEIRGMANFFRDPQWHDFVLRLMDQSGDEKKNGDPRALMTPDETQRFAEFRRTQVGQALERNGGRFVELLSAELNVALTRLRPRFEAQVLTLVCEALEDQCTEEMRQASHQT